MPTVQKRTGVAANGNNLTITQDVMNKLSPAQLSAAQKQGYNVSQVKPIPGNTMDTTTEAPYIAPTGPVTTTTAARAEVKNNADFIDNKITGGKTVTNTTTSNGKTTKTYSDGTTEVTDTANVDTQRDVLDKQNIILSDTEKLDQDIRDRYAALQVGADESYKQLVQNTQNMFASTRAKLNDSNKRFESKTSQGQYLNNGFRYTPQASEGMVYDAEQYGIARLADLDAQESKALQLALDAKNNNDYKALQDYTSAVRNIQQDKINLLDKMTNQIKTIEDTDKNIRNMNTNEAKIMQSMVDSYILTAGSMDAAETEAYYEKKSKELSELMGFTVAPEFIKAQVEGANASAKLEVNKDLTTINGFYTDSLGRPLTDAEGKRVPFEKEDWGEWIEGNMLNVGTYDENGNKVIKTYELKGGTKSYAETLKDLPPTQTNITLTALSQAYSGPMPELLMTPDETFVKTTNPAYRKIGNGGMQCAEFVNRIVGTSFESGKAANKESPNTLRVGSVASWAPPGSGEFEHAGIIIGEEGDNWIIKSANLRGNGIISTDTIPKSVIKGGYTPKGLDNLPNEVSGVYDPLKDKQLTPIGQNKDGTGIYLDKNTGQSISESEAKSKYGQSINNVATQFTPEQIAVMSTMTGKPTAGDKVTLKKYGLDEAKLGQYRQQEASKTKVLTPDQRSIYNSEKSRFMSDPVVKTFNESLTQLDNSVASLNSESGPGDIAGVYQFMKTLDPTSVVRETEFQIAARSAGVLPYIGNTWKRLENGEVLTAEQRDAFSKLMKAYVANKGKQYNRLYDDLARVFELSEIPKEYMPTRAGLDNAGDNPSQPEYADFSSI